MQLHYASATDLAAGIRARRFSSRELLEAFLTRVSALDGSINAIVVRDFDRARAAADAADAALVVDEARVQGIDEPAIHSELATQLHRHAAEMAGFLPLLRRYQAALAR